MRLGQLFSEYFLREGVTTTAAYKQLSADDARLDDLRRRLERVYAAFPVAGSPNEAQTEQDLIFPILDALGWGPDARLVQPRAARKGRADVPDMLLFPDAGAKRRAGAEREDRRFWHGVAVVENKRWDRPLDRPSKDARQGDDEREVPSSQMLRYLSRAEVLSERRIQWGVLTNGRLWRLYYQGAKSRSEEFLEIDLPSLLDVPALAPDLLAPRDDSERDHWLRVFALMFGRASFVERADGERTFHVLALDEGQLWEQRVARSLSDLVFRQVFPLLVRALDAADAQRPKPRTPAYLRELKEAALTLLYRLLFVLYAEDRELLPVRDLRYDNYGLHPIRAEVARRRDENDTFAAAIGPYCNRLRGLFRAIGGGEPSLGLPPYDGGLFDPEAAPLLERVELPDAALAPLLDTLSRHDDGTHKRRISYRDLSVQQLGSIYERLLEFEVVEKDGAVAVDPNEAARKGSGSFYTHEVLVQLILERAVGPLITERVAAFEERARALGADRRPKAERLKDLAALDPATGLLDLKVCDPAMGSGHFLVSLVDFLADRVLEAVADAPLLVPWADDDHPYESPLVERVALIRARILELAERDGWKLDQAQLDDRRLVRRMILKRVVHGVDKNPMAVELAKVALWLHTFTTGAPLSFLDHHLRCGDSLLGLRVHDAQSWLQERGALPINRYVVPAQRAAEAMSRIETITDSDITEVEESASTFEAVREATEPLDAFLSLIEAERLMGVFDAAPKRRPTEARRTRSHDADLAAWQRGAALQDVLDGNLGDPLAIARGAVMVAPDELRQQLSMLPPAEPEQATLFPQSAADDRHRLLAQSLVDEARALAREHRFLHWEVAFPNVWREWLSADRKGGFDAVIGNPPYVRQEQIRPFKPALKKAYDVFDGTADLYVYFYELGLRLLRPGGRLSYVVTNKWLRAGYAEELRGLLSERAWLEAVIDFGHAKRFFPGADVFPGVIVARRPDGGEAPETTEVCQIPRDVVRLDRVSQQVKDMAFPLPRAVFSKRAWALDPPEVAALMDKIRRAGVPLKDYASAKPYRGILTGFNEAFLIDTATRDALVAADPGCADIIKPYLRGQDIERWYAPWRGLWMIVIASSANRLWPWSDAADDAERIFETTYPALYRRFAPDKEALRKREDRGKFWWELRACAYYDEFESYKVMYQEIQFHSAYAIDRDGSLCNNKAKASEYLVAVLNSPLMWWHNWRYLVHLKDEALSPMAYLMESLPIAKATEEARAEASSAVRELLAIRKSTAEVSSMLHDWYMTELEVAKPNRILLQPFDLSSDSFVEAVRKARGKHNPLSAAAVRAVRDEYASTVQPLQAKLYQAEHLERRLSDLVNEAYGLTPEEVRLMWDTAPPRMPLAEPDAADDAEGEEAA